MTLRKETDKDLQHVKIRLPKREITPHLESRSEHKGHTDSLDKTLHSGKELSSDNRCEKDSDPVQTGLPTETRQRNLTAQFPPA